MDSSNVSDPPEWVQTLCTQVNREINKYIYEFGNYVENLGVNEETRHHWAHDYQALLVDICIENNERIAKKQEGIIKEIQELLQQLEILHKKLQRTLPAYGEVPKGLYDELKFLKEEKSKIEKEVKEKEKQFSVLRERELILCQSMGKTPRQISEHVIPDLDLFQKYIEELDNEKFRREENFFSLKEEILSLAQELNVEPLTDFEKKIFTTNDSLFQVTDSNMKELEKYKNDMKTKIQEAREEIETLKGEVEKMWQVLEVDLQYQQEFRKIFDGHTSDIKEALKKEKKKCEKIKMENIQKFVEKLRTELKELWHKCRFTEDEREQMFTYMNETLYTEDLLEIHEREVSRLQKHLAQNRELYELLDKHDKLWKKGLELQNKSVAPDRLKNRGGQLLKEEKERNRINKQLPDIQKKLIILADEYEKKNHKEFRTFGQTLEEYFDSILDNAKENRKKVMKQQKELTLSTPRKSPMNPSRSALKVYNGGSTTNLLKAPNTASVKRRLATPNTMSAKKHRPDKEIPATVPKLKVNNKIIRLSKEKIVAKYRRFSRSKKLKLDTRENDSKEMISGENLAPYEQFEKNITIYCRSTDHFDSSPLAQPLPKTPIKTAEKKTPTKLNNCTKSPQKLSKAVGLELLF